MAAPQNTLRDRSILRAAAALLDDTGQFDMVRVQPPGETGDPTDWSRVAWLELAGWREVNQSCDADDWPVDRAVIFKLTIGVRDEDAGVRDDEADRLSQVASNTLNFAALGGETYPFKTLIDAGTWANPSPPERRVVLRGTWTQQLGGPHAHADFPE